jgi:hypothetical protein
LEIDELGNLMAQMGLKLSEKRLGELMNKYDVDGGGSIEMSEFLMLLKSQKQEAQLRIKEMLEQPIMILRNGPKKQHYVPPEIGFLHIKVIDGFARKKIYRVLTTTDREYIESMSSELGGNASKMVSSSLENTKLRLDEALTLAETMMNDAGDRLNVVKKLLKQMDRPEDAQHFVLSVIGNNRAEMLRLKKDLGAAMRPLLGNPNGYYVLDLADSMNRMCLERLLEISATDGTRRQESSKIGYGRIGDLSQKGNFSCFRNEMFNGEPITLTINFVSPMPEKGILEFDFSGGGRPPRDVLVLSDARIIKILRSHFLLEARFAAIAMLKLREAAEAGHSTLGCNGVTYYECPMERAKLISEHMEAFYNNVQFRSKQHLDSLEKENFDEVDHLGRLIDMYERDKYPVAPDIGDYYVRQEAKQRERDEADAVERAKAEEKAARLAERYALYRGQTVDEVKQEILKKQKEQDGDSVSEGNEDETATSVTDEPSNILSDRGGSQVLLKVETTGDSDMEDNHALLPEGATAPEATAIDAANAEEGNDWLKTFELMKEAMRKKKEKELKESGLAPKEKIVEAPRRRNFMSEEVKNNKFLIILFFYFILFSNRVLLLNWYQMNFWISSKQFYTHTISKKRIRLIV